jgi:hypothetical protein
MLPGAKTPLGNCQRPWLAREANVVTYLVLVAGHHQRFVWLDNHPVLVFPSEWCNDDFRVNNRYLVHK